MNMNDIRNCATDSSRWEALGKELAKQMAEGQGCGSSRFQFVKQRAEVYAKAWFGHQRFSL